MGGEQSKASRKSRKTVAGGDGTPRKSRKSIAPGTPRKSKKSIVAGKASTGPPPSKAKKKFMAAVDAVQVSNLAAKFTERKRSDGELAIGSGGSGAEPEQVDKRSEPERKASYNFKFKFLSTPAGG